MLRENILKINTLTNSIIHLQNKITRINEDLESELHCVHYSKVLQGFGYMGNNLNSDGIKTILNNMEYFEKEGVEYVTVTIEHTREPDEYEDYDNPVTNIEICGDVKYTEEEIEQQRVEKLNEIKELENRIVEIENELKGLMA